TVEHEIIYQVCPFLRTQLFIICICYTKMKPFVSRKIYLYLFFGYIKISCHYINKFCYLFFGFRDTILATNRYSLKLCRTTFGTLRLKFSSMVTARAALEYSMIFSA